MSIFSTIFQKKINIDLLRDGKELSINLQEESLNAYLSQLTFNNWPFGEQNPDQFFYYLFKYGVVAYFKITIGSDNNIWQFAPVKLTSTTSNSRWFPSNAANWTISWITSECNPQIDVIASRNEIMGNGQFFFADPSKSSPEVRINHILKQYSSVVAANVINRINKNPAEINAAEDINNLADNDLTAIFGSTKGVKKIKNDKVKNGAIPAYLKNNLQEFAPDLFSSFLNESKEWRNEVFTYLGVNLSELTFGKASAQETNAQLEPKKSIAISQFLARVNQLQSDFKRFNKIANKQVEVIISPRIKKWLESLEKEKEEESK